MSKYLDFEDEKYQGKYTQVNAIDLKEHVGKKIVYLTNDDIDKSGRGYVFPQYNIIDKVVGKKVLLASMDEINIRDIVECGVRGI